MNNSWYDIYIYLHLVSNMKYDLKYDIYTYCSWVYPLTHFRVNTIMWIMLFFVHEYPMHLDWDCDAPSAWFILYDIALCQFTLFYFTFISYCILATIYIYIWHWSIYMAFDIPHSSSNPGYHPDVFQAALTLLKQLQVAQASGACSEMGT